MAYFDNRFYFGYSCFVFLMANENITIPKVVHFGIDICGIDAKRERSIIMVGLFFIQIKLFVFSYL
ncbi:MAG: hypothetical protein [Bacteriophage sp.]|nr:MAG: hypothetical protein [Bacteriophage sp.]